MSLYAPPWACEQNLPPSEKIVLLALAVRLHEPARRRLVAGRRRYVVLLAAAFGWA